VRREFAGSLHPLGWLMPDLTWRSVLERTGGAAPGVLARSRLMVDCSGPSLTSPTATCLASSGDETFVWEVAADAGTTRPIASTTGRVLPRSYQDRTLVFWRDRELLMLWRDTNQAIRLAAESQSRRPHDACYDAGHLVTLTRALDRDVVMRYPMPPPD
jgi:hypothetical protein